jgi:hypothetical protein
MTDSRSSGREERMLDLERCGARRRWKLGTVTSLVVGSHLLLWLSSIRGPAQIQGMFLPSRRRFTMTTPAALSSVGGLALGEHYLYVLGQGKAGPTLWRTTLPTG